MRTRFCFFNPCFPSPPPPFISELSGSLAAYIIVRLTLPKNPRLEKKKTGEKKEREREGRRRSEREEREREGRRMRGREGEGVMDQPPAKRLRMTVSVGGGCAGAVMPASPGSRKLRQTLFVVLFLVSLRNTVTASLSQIGRMVQRHVDHAFHKYHGVISSKLESMQGQIEGLHQEVKELAHLCSNRQADQRTRIEPNHESRSNTSFRLCFLNNLQTPIYTEKNIAAENNTAIKIGIFEGHTMITTGPLSKLKIEIMVLRGDFSDDDRKSWTEEEFNSHVVRGRDGHGFVLGGNCIARLINGEASLGRLCFKEGSSRTRSRMFVIAARVCNSENTGVRVQEAVMKPVTVRDRRNQANEKRHPPELDDEVYRLEEISKDGIYHKRLQKAHIFTVQDFLKALNKNANKLREDVLKMKKQHNSFVKMVKHARECSLKDRHELKAYQNEEENAMLFFNCVHELVGAAFHANYVTHKKFDPAQKARVNKLKECAHDKLEDISFDYVMKNNFPEQICTTPNTAAGPSFPYPSDHEVSHQGTAGAMNLGHDEHSCVAKPLPPTEQHDPLGQVNSYGSFKHTYEEDQLAVLQYVNPGDLGGDAARLDEFPDFDLLIESPVPYFGDDAAQPSYADDDLQPSSSAFPGSCHGDN